MEIRLSTDITYENVLQALALLLYQIYIFSVSNTAAVNIININNSLRQAARQNMKFYVVLLRLVVLFAVFPHI